VTRVVLALSLAAALVLVDPVTGRGGAPACGAQNLSLSLVVSRKLGTLVATAGLYHFRGKTCHLQTTLTLRLLTKLQQGKPLPVKGNPARVNADVTLKLKDRATVLWMWRNWCGSHEGVAATVLTGAGGGTGVRLKPPACTRKGKPSTLSRAR
jgi:hypothetical protein